MLGDLQECSVRPPLAAKVLQVRLTPEILQQLRKSNGEGISIAFDADMSLRIGQDSHSFSIAPESTTVNVYRASKRSGRTSLESVGTIEHKLLMRRQLGGSISEKLKSRQAEEAAAKLERSVQATEIGVKTKKGMPTMKPGLSTTNQLHAVSPARRSPFLQPRKSPLLVASSPKPTQIPIRTRLIQMVAIGAASEAELSAKLKVPVENLETLLKEVAIATGNAWALKDELFKEIKVWDWKGYTTAERTAVISRATEAFDRLSLPPKHNARIRLIHPEKRAADERNDTSPLSLNAPVTATSLIKDLSPKKGKPDSGTQAITSTATGVDVRSANSGPEKKVTAKGILTAGKKAPVKKKRVVEENSDSPEEPRKRQKTSATVDEAPSSRTIAKPAANLSSNAPRASSPHGSASKKTLAASVKSVTSPEDETRSQASTDVSPRPTKHIDRKSTLQTSTNGSSSKTGSPHSASKSSTRSQTPTAVVAKVAPSASSLDSVEEDVNNRTSSITSSTTELSDRSVASASTVPSSTSSPPPKVRSKFLTKRTMPSTSAGRTPQPTTGTAAKSIAKSPLVVTQEVSRTDKATSGVSKKRSAGSNSHVEPQAKRLRTIDLQNMARDYKRLYPEYKLLHDKITSRVDDQDLFSKFMKLHNQMSTWKQTLYAAEKEYDE